MSGCGNSACLCGDSEWVVDNVTVVVACGVCIWYGQ